jgi:transmembrane sensor
MGQQDAKQILLKYQAGTATDEEKAFVENWLLYGTSGDPELTEDELLEDLVAIRQKLNIDTPQRKTITLWPRMVAAALIILSVGGYFLMKQSAKDQLHADIAPGSNKAILTLANGQQISLTDAKFGVLASQQSTVIKKTDSGEVAYYVNNKPTANTITYNTITTPGAGKWGVILPDGSKAWLDALSSIRFPTKFNANNRTVKITGQVYFEVVHNAASPFRVEANGQIVEDIGTHFNINAYANEPTVKTTLLEGSVKVSKGDQSIVLKPGQQSVLSATSNKIRVEDAEDASSWKDGYFHFDKANIQTVMRQFSRWYNVDVTYEGQAPTLMITGKVQRNLKASEALKVLSYLDIHFKIEDKKIIILP